MFFQNSHFQKVGGAVLERGGGGAAGGARTTAEQTVLPAAGGAGRRACAAAPRPLGHAGARLRVRPLPPAAAVGRTRAPRPLRAPRRRALAQGTPRTRPPQVIEFLHRNPVKDIATFLPNLFKRIFFLIVSHKMTFKGSLKSI